MISAFLIWSVVALSWVLIGLWSRHTKGQAGFWANTKEPGVKHTAEYNRAIGKLWMISAGIFEVIGLPLLAAGQNSPIALLPILGVIPLVIGMMVMQGKIAQKYK